MPGMGLGGSRAINPWCDDEDVDDDDDVATAVAEDDADDTDNGGGGRCGVWGDREWGDRDRVTLCGDARDRTTDGTTRGVWCDFDCVVWTSVGETAKVVVVVVLVVVHVILWFLPAVSGPGTSSETANPVLTLLIDSNE